MILRVTQHVNRMFSSDLNFSLDQLKYPNFSALGEYTFKLHDPKRRYFQKPFSNLFLSTL